MAWVEGAVEQPTSPKLQRPRFHRGGLQEARKWPLVAFCGSGHYGDTKRALGEKTLLGA
jgi:hypothetical protein